MASIKPEEKDYEIQKEYTEEGMKFFWRDKEGNKHYLQNLGGENAKHRIYTSKKCR